MPVKIELEHNQKIRAYLLNKKRTVRSLAVALDVADSYMSQVLNGRIKLQERFYDKFAKSIPVKITDLRKGIITFKKSAL